TLVTQATLGWFQLDWYSGTVAPGETDTIPGTFNSTGYAAGTTKVADMIITSNAHPNKTETALDVIMIVIDCLPIYTTGCSWGDGFTFFDIDNQINNTSGCDNLNGNGWSQFLGIPPAVLEPGMTYDFNMSTGYSNNYATVWIDFNDDMYFTPDEMVLDCENMDAAGQVFTFPGTIPATAGIGIHLMRARTNWLDCADDPCAVYTYGETEDYFVEIQSVQVPGILEGYVYEFGTNTPIVGAIVEVLDGPPSWTAVTDNTGFYSIDGIYPDTYDVMASHIDYCSQTIAGVNIATGTNTQDFELQWAEILTNPATEISTVIPENTIEATQLEIINNGNCDLDYNIELTELSETFGGPVANNENVVFTGTPLSMEEFYELKHYIPKTFYPTISDEGIPLVPNPDPWTENSEAMEEIFGTPANAWTAGPRTRGNFYECTTTTYLAEHRFYLDVAAATQMWFCVYEGTALEGVYNLISASDVSPMGPGSGWFSSGQVNVTMQAGNWYMIVASFEEECTYYYETGISPYPIPASFGHLVEGAGFSFAPTTNFPPDATQNISGTPGPQIAYHQTLVTKAWLDWFQLDWLSGTVPAGASVTIPGEFNSTGYATGTTKVADLAITSNAHPGKTLTNLAVTMVVGGGAELDLKVFLEGPFFPANGNMFTFLNDFGYIPLTQPYNPSLPYYTNNNPAWLYQGTESVTAIPLGVVDWILLELRDAPDGASAGPATTFEKMAAFLMADGSVVGLDGQSLPSFNYILQNELFVVIYHRNHLSIMNSGPIPMSGNGYSWDYTAYSANVYGNVLGCKELMPGVWGMISSDGSADLQVNNIDKMDVWAVDAALSGYLGGDFTMDGTCGNQDKLDYWEPNVGAASQVPKN
ncbi:MAG: carboxypeptidase-like regulatory domain-containing protein, partial [Bacteroidales bacterium]|nr:carboxypeptidase-like regulatory domain-containing protein [Bacteroidales bacterium]